MDITDVWVANDEGTEIVRARDIIGASLDYDGNVTVRLTGADGPCCTPPGTPLALDGMRYAGLQALRRSHRGAPVVCRSVSELVSTDVAPSTSRPLNPWRLFFCPLCLQKNP